jgi:hypothetical protein
LGISVNKDGFIFIVHMVNYRKRSSFRRALRCKSRKLLQNGRCNALASASKINIPKLIWWNWGFISSGRIGFRGWSGRRRLTNRDLRPGTFRTVFVMGVYFVAIMPDRPPLWKFHHNTTILGWDLLSGRGDWWRFDTGVSFRFDGVQGERSAVHAVTAFLG